MVIRKQLEEGTLITKMITQAPSKYVQQTKPMAPAWETWGGYLEDGIQVTMTARATK